MTKTVTIDGKPVPLRATAALPRLYRATFGRDFFSEINSLSGKNDGAGMLETLENLTYLMARSADPEHVPDDITTWLDSLDDPAAIFNAASDVIDLYTANLKTTAVAKKKRG